MTTRPLLQLGVIPAKAGIHFGHRRPCPGKMDSRFRGNDSVIFSASNARALRLGEAVAAAAFINAAGEALYQKKDGTEQEWVG